MQIKDNIRELKSTSILVTGGTGSFGKAFVDTVLHNYPQVTRLVVFSRDELKQYEMAQQFPRSKYEQIRYFIGDVRDGARLKRACEGIDTIVHAAALKQVPAAEDNPMECILTNVYGAQNVLDAALDCGVNRVVALSTDKAAAPINLYGATKLCSDKLFVAANNIKGGRDLSLSVVRYGNVMGSRGSVIPFFLNKRKTGTIPVTDPDMTRFNITLEQGVNMVLRAIDRAMGGEIFVPKIPSYRILDMAEAIAPNCETEIVGVRPGEKIHEEMVTSSDSYTTVDAGDYFVILPQIGRFLLSDYQAHYAAKKVKTGFVYNSGTNEERLDVDDIRALIRKHVAADFTF
ncbi:MAG: UDP-N-acetylglucosamine 4,6-dehydratase (inverting) [Arenicellaceae bacterium]|nr:UDP-N-acetylglucosamine 4,6-dehydratase (inverting) [Arenicellaceae bacterium]